MAQERRDSVTPEERFERIEAQTERNTVAIKDLIVVSRTLLSSVGELHEAQKHTEAKLNILIDTVDRFVKSWQKPNGNQ